VKPNNDNPRRPYIGFDFDASNWWVSWILVGVLDISFVEIEIKPKNESKKFIRNWLPDSKIEDYVVSATIEAIKPKV
jgi:hypothetical protein